MSLEPRPPLGEPSADDVRQALELILKSTAMRGSPQLAVFLRFVVEAALRGEGGRLKGYTIGVEALGRNASFDPQSDPIVRVEASRLRRALDRYYADQGAHDPVIVTLPRGSYVPTFAWREEIAELAVPVSWRDCLVDLGWRRFAAVSAGILALIVAVAVLAVREFANPASDAGVREPAGPVLASVPPRGNGMPMFYIEPLRAVGQVNHAVLSAPALSERMIDAFARFDTINVVPGPPRADLLGGHRHDYAMSGIVDYGEGRATVALKVVDAAEGTVAWSRTFDAVESTNPRATEEKIIVAVATALLPANGVIRARDHARQLASNDGDPRYRCVLKAANAFRGYDVAAQRRGRICLERLTASDPSFDVGLSFLAMIYSREYHHGLEGSAGDPKMLEAALGALRRAIEMNPMRARAHEVLMLILHARGDVDAALAAGEKAIELNRYDMTMVAAYGGRKILSGEVEAGLALLRKAGDFWEIRPAWQHFFLFLGYYLTGDARMAAYEARLLAAEPYPLARVAEVLAAAALGEADRARALHQRLIAEYPQWRDARHELARNITAPAMADRLARDLAAAGSGR